MQKDSRKRVLVVGSFGSSKGDGRQGGLAFACSSLVNSELAEHFSFLKIDSTISSIRNRSGLSRLPSAAYRIGLALWYMLFHRISYVICFASHGNSFLEKGVMVLSGRILRKRVLLLPRSGHLLRQIESNSWFRKYVRVVLQASWKVGCQSEYWRDFYSRLLSEDHDRVEHCFTIENWLPDDAFVEENAEVASSNSNDNSFLVGFFNRIETDKGIYEFLNAVAAAQEKNPRVKGIVFGDGVELDNVQSWIRERRLEAIIEYRGWIGQEFKCETLRKLDAIVFTSHAEGFPNSLLEVIALKIPCIATSVGAINDIIGNGHSGLLVQPNDVTGMAQGIEEYCSNEDFRRTMAENAYKRAVRVNRIANVASKLQEIMA